MKKFVFILSFAFATFFSNATFATSTDNSLVDTKAEIILTEANESVDISDAIVKAEPIVIVIIYGDGTVIIIIIE